VYNILPVSRDCPFLIAIRYSLTFVVYITESNTICVGHHYTQANTNNVDKTLSPPTATGGKDEQKIVCMRKSQHVNLHKFYSVILVFLLYICIVLCRVVCLQPTLIYSISLKCGRVGIYSLIISLYEGRLIFSTDIVCFLSSDLFA
jgi:hypothetical protein